MARSDSKTTKARTSVTVADMEPVDVSAELDAKRVEIEGLRNTAIDDIGGIKLIDVPDNAFSAAMAAERWGTSRSATTRRLNRLYKEDKINRHTAPNGKCHWYWPK